MENMANATQVSIMYRDADLMDQWPEINAGLHILSEEASYRLIQTMSFWAPGTVFVSVVDPGVGSERESVAVLTKTGHVIVTPDNGTLSHIAKEIGILERRRISETVNRLKGTEKTSIFHGRDLFAYCAARLASGVIDFEGVGPEYPVEEIVLY